MRIVSLVVHTTLDTYNKIIFEKLFSVTLVEVWSQTVVVIFDECLNFVNTRNTQRYNKEDYCDVLFAQKKETFQ